jgi:hypothetical protein
MFPLSLILPGKWTHFKGTPSRHGDIALVKPTSSVDACVEGFYTWSAPNESWSSEALLEELAAIMPVRRAINFPLRIYTN